MYAFTYNTAASVDEAADTLRKSSEGHLLAGGMSLIPTMKLRLSSPGELIDLNGLSTLQGISRDGDTLIIGAMTRHAEVATSAEVAEAIPALAALAGCAGCAACTGRPRLVLGRIDASDSETRRCFEDFSNSNVTPSASKRATYCLIKADFGWVKIFIKSFVFNFSNSTRIGKRPWSSGIISDGVLM